MEHRFAQSNDDNDDTNNLEFILNSSTSVTKTKESKAEKYF